MLNSPRPGRSLTPEGRPPESKFLPNLRVFASRSKRENEGRRRRSRTETARAQNALGETLAPCEDGYLCHAPSPAAQRAGGAGLPPPVPGGGGETEAERGGAAGG